MPSSTTRTVGPAVHTIDASALESLEAINHQIKDGGFTLRLSEVKGPIMDRLKRSHFLEELTGKVHLTEYDAVSSINPDLRCTSWRHRDFDQSGVEYIEICPHSDLGKTGVGGGNQNIATITQH